MIQPTPAPLLLFVSFSCVGEGNEETRVRAPCKVRKGSGLANPELLQPLCPLGVNGVAGAQLRALARIAGYRDIQPAIHLQLYTKSPPQKKKSVPCRGKRVRKSRYATAWS